MNLNLFSIEAILVSASLRCDLEQTTTVIFTVI